MAREQQDRENLLRDATALVERVELRLPQFSQPVFAGFRREGGVSVYFGADPVYHFNSFGQLRRAYVEARLIKAEHGRLVRLTRSRREGEVQLLRHDLDTAETDALVGQIQSDLGKLRDALAGDGFEIVGQVSDCQDVVGRLRDWLATFDEVRIAPSPRAG